MLSLGMQILNTFIWRRFKRVTGNLMVWTESFSLCIAFSHIPVDLIFFVHKTKKVLDLVIFKAGWNVSLNIFPVFLFYVLNLSLYLEVFVFWTKGKIFHHVKGCWEVFIVFFFWGAFFQISLAKSNIAINSLFMSSKDFIVDLEGVNKVFDCLLIGMFSDIVKTEIIVNVTDGLVFFTLQ